MKKIIALMLVASFGLLQGCSAEIGTDDWCKEIMTDQSKAAEAMYDHPKEVQACSAKMLGKMMGNM